MNEQALIAAAIAVGAAIATASVGAVASRRWGLPGLARQIADEQAKLISTLEASIKELRARNDDLEERNAALEARVHEQELLRRQYQNELRMVRRELMATEGDLLDLYRTTGKAAPTRLVTQLNHHVEVTQVADEDGDEP